MGSSTPCPELPAEVRFPPGTRVAKVVAGADHSLALSESGDVFSWGANANGQLGVRSGARIHSSGSPSRVSGLPPCAQLAASSVSAAVSREGRLYVWGSHPCLNPTSSPSTPNRTIENSCVQEVAWLRPKRVQGVALGTSHAVVVTTDQCLFAWGETSKALGRKLVSAGVALWASDKQVAVAAHAEAAEAGGICHSEQVTRTSNSGGTTGLEVTRGEGCGGTNGSGLDGVDSPSGEPAGPFRWLGASLERISASPGCSVVRLQAPDGMLGGEGAVPLLRLRNQRGWEVATNDQVAHALLPISLWLGVGRCGIS